MDRTDFFIKSGYTSRSEAAYFDDRPYAVSDIVHQPDAYTLASYLASRYGADTIVDVGCGSARKLMALSGVRKIGVDFGINLERCREEFPGEIWIEADLETCRQIPLDDRVIANSVVVCADVIEHLVDPHSLLALLASLADKARAVIITTPERDLVRGKDDLGPPANPSHIREWSLDEFAALLEASGVGVSFIGLTVNNNQNLEKKTILAVIDRRAQPAVSPVPADFRPLAIIASYNDRDIALQTTGKLLDDGIDVHVLDNWSDDGTFEQLSAMAESYPGLKIERFPAQPPQYYEWAAILQEKADIAGRHPGRWIIHQDSDEIRSSPWAGISFRHGLWLADRSGFNAVDFTVLDFRPVEDDFDGSSDPESALTWFEFGKRPGHFNQIKAWKQGADAAELTVSGGHDVRFSDRRVFPYKFLLKHYPLRSVEQARRKIFLERRQRFSPQERQRGWHVQYDGHSEGDTFLWPRDQLLSFDEVGTRRTFLTEMISGIGIVC